MSEKRDYAALWTGIANVLVNLGRLIVAIISL